MKYQVTSLLMTVCILNFSCKKLIDIDPPKNQLTPDKVFNNSSAVTAATANLYTVLNSVDGNFIIPSGIYTDELNTINVDEGSVELTNGTLAVNNSNVQTTWQQLYVTIYTANSLIEGLETATTLPDSVKNQCLGEAKFMRAYCHFMLTNIYGDVPLILTTSVSSNANAVRTPASDVMKQVIADLNSTVTLLPAAYTGSGEKVRANKWAVSAYLSKAYLYTGDFPDAEKEASAVINSGQYQLMTDLNDVFLANSNEAILQLWNANGYTSLTSVPYSGEPTYQIAPDLLNAFEANDNRKNEWIDTTTITGTTYYYAFKYKQNTQITGANSEYIMYIRLGEVYLIRAEARAQQGELSAATSDLNAIRNRAGLSNSAATIQADLITAIYHERQVELFNEGGNRFFDLKRTGMINTVLSKIKPLWKPTASLFPIPQSEILADPKLTQNPGYNL